MFLDIVGSTRIAERIGGAAFHGFLNRFYYVPASMAALTDLSTSGRASDRPLCVTGQHNIDSSFLSIEPSQKTL